MATIKPRVTFTMEESLKARVDDFQFSSRSRNQTQAIVELLEKGLAAAVVENADKTEFLKKADSPFVESGKRPLSEDDSLFKILYDVYRQFSALGLDFAFTDFLAMTIIESANFLSEYKLVEPEISVQSPELRADMQYAKAIRNIDEIRYRATTFFRFCCDYMSNAL